MFKPGALLLVIVFAACQKSGGQQPGTDAGPDTGIGTGNDAGADATDDGAATDTGAAPVSVTLSETEISFPTPDVSHTLTATVTTTVTWASSDTYIATVSAGGVVTSVSGGQATISATSTADPTKSASCTVTIIEPSRARATTYTDAKCITSGPIKIIMAGDSLTRTYAANTADQTGWGQVLGQFLTSDATVDNTLANGGRSSRSFYNEVGRWDQVKARLTTAQAAGTPAFVFIMFAHNDQKKVTDTDGPLYLTFASNNQNGTVAGTYYDYLERYIVETRDLGGIPVIFTPFVREYLAGTPAMVTIEGQHDITAWSAAMVNAHAATNTLPFVYISGDQTHIRELGALLMAQEAVRALNAQGILT